MRQELVELFSRGKISASQMRNLYTCKSCRDTGCLRCRPGSKIRCHHCFDRGCGRCSSFVR